MSNALWPHGSRPRKRLLTMRRSKTLPLLPQWTKLQLKRPGAARLLVELPIGRGDRGRRHQQVRIIERFLAPELLAALAHPGGIDAGIDDEMCDMDVFRTQLAGHRLRHRPQSELGAGKGGKAAAAAQARGRTGEEDIALAVRQHQPGRLPPGQEAGPAGHFPDLSEYAVGGFQNREIDVGANVEDADFERRVLVGIVEESRDLVLLPCVQRARDDRSAGRLDLLDQWLQLGAVAPAGEYGETFGREFLGDLATDVIAGADDSHGGIAFLHCGAPLTLRHCEERSDEAIHTSCAVRWIASLRSQ